MNQTVARSPLGSVIVEHSLVYLYCKNIEIINKRNEREYRVEF